MAKKSQPIPKNFEDGMRELETILSEIENGTLGIEDSLIKYERGAFLIQHCRTVLNKAQEQIESLSKAPESSDPEQILTPPEDQA